MSETALEESIHGLINKVNVGNIRIVIKELLKLNIARGRAFLVSSVIEAQNASPTFTNVYAALVAVVNSWIPNIGYLVLRSLIVELNSTALCKVKINTCKIKALFIAHLVNQRVAHELLAVQLLTLLVKEPTEGTVDVATAFLKECGQHLTKVSSQDVNAMFASLKNILLKKQLSNNVKCKIEVMSQLWTNGFKDQPALMKELDLVPKEERFTHDASDLINYELSHCMIAKFGVFSFISTQNPESECLCTLHTVMASITRPPLANDH